MKSDEELKRGYTVEIKKDTLLITLTLLSEETDPENNIRISQLVLKDLEKAVDSTTGVGFNLLADLFPNSR